MKLEHEKNDTVEKDKFNLKKEIFSWVETLIISLIIVSLIITFVGRMMNVDGSSMEPTLHDKDRIITTSIHGAYQYNDVVVIRRKGDTSLVKRIIALEGDKVDINFETGCVYVNDKLLTEPFINEITMNPIDFKGPVVVPEGHVFVMGDNRNHSDDSRNSKIGMIDERNIFGKVIFRMFPLNKMGKIE
ncbi:MAG: signal peptidase I [Oscillospiraceae bacterium]